MVNFLPILCDSDKLIAGNYVHPEKNKKKKTNKKEYERWAEIIKYFDEKKEVK